MVKATQQTHIPSTSLSLYPSLLCARRIQTGTARFTERLLGPHSNGRKTKSGKCAPKKRKKAERERGERERERERDRVQKKNWIA